MKSIKIKSKFMKTTKLIRGAFFAAVLAVIALTGCEKLDTYSISAPAGLQGEIDSIAAAKASMDTGDTTYIDIATAIVGAEDYSSAWWTAFSDYFTIPLNKRLVLEFVNHNGGSENNWNNWNLAVASEADRDADNYAEYFVLRSDAYGWGNDDFDLGLVSQNYPDTDGDEDIWNDFRTTMDGAYVTIEIDHSVSGNVFVTATAVGTNGTELVMTYQQPVPATQDIVAFLISDASYFEIKQAYLIPSQVTILEDVEPVSIEIEGTPDFVEVGSEDFWGNGIATVTFADGSSEQVDTADVSFTVTPDMTTTGEKTVIVAYSKTRQGEFTKAVSTYYNLEVINAVSSLEVTTMPDVTSYTFPGPAAPVFDPTGMVVTATYSDGTTGVITNENLQFEIPGADGAQEAVVSYVGAASTVTTTVPVTNVMGGTNQVGATDLSSGFWTAFSNEYNVASGSSKTFKMDLYSSEANNWNSPIVILRKANLTEYAVVRMDNFGWGDGYSTATATNDWNFDVFAENLDEAYIEVTVTDAGNGTANVRYDVTYANGDTHFQLYEGISVDSSDLNCTITIDGCYVDIASVE
jgi:hypothetical protein